MDTENNVPAQNHLSFNLKPGMLIRFKYHNGKEREVIGWVKEIGNGYLKVGNESVLSWPDDEIKHTRTYEKKYISNLFCPGYLSIKLFGDGTL